MSDLEPDLLRSLKVKFDGTIHLPIYEFPLGLNSNVWLNSAPSRDITLHSLSELDFDVPRSNLMKQLDCAYMATF